MKKTAIILFAAISLCLSGCTSPINVNISIDDEEQATEQPIQEVQIIETPVQETPDNRVYMAKVYSEYMESLGTLTTTSQISSSPHTYLTNELWYYMDDVNNDGILDLAVSAENYCSNGIKIITYRNGRMEFLLDGDMPFSSGVEILTLATYEGTYGVFFHRQNSTDSFSYSLFDEAGNTSIYISGSHSGNSESDNWMINNQNVGRENWNNTFNSIRPIVFYNLETLKNIN
jgi:hypothetical protein